jgi:superfamily II DNA/RNA helicase
MRNTIRLPWKGVTGLDTIQTIVKRCMTWTNGLYAWQLPLVAQALDGDDYLCITATGDGKSALFAIPIIVLLEYNRNPELYPKGLITRPNPISVVITPTKGLANSFVSP